jgi:hypothetical protein
MWRGGFGGVEGGGVRGGTMKGGRVRGVEAEGAESEGEIQWGLSVRGRCGEVGVGESEGAELEG